MTCVEIPAHAVDSVSAFGPIGSINLGRPTSQGKLASKGNQWPRSRRLRVRRGDQANQYGLSAGFPSQNGMNELREKEPQPNKFSDIKNLNGRYWIRTSDPFRVKEVRYHCANRPIMLPCNSLGDPAEPVVWQN